jgi:hypothetical protein
MLAMNNNDLGIENDSVRKIIISGILIGFIGIFLYISQAKAWQQAISVAGVALMISGASLLSGGLLGFLFGIPRTLQQQDKPVERTDEQIQKGRMKGTTYGANTNLEQISDWLTKILVGVGLTQISSLPEALQGFADYTSMGLGNFPSSKAFSLALLIYFLICGFLISYLWTRLYLPGAFREADIAAFGGALNEMKNKVSELERQAELDAKALNFIQGYLNPSPGVPPVGKDEKEIQEKLESVIIPTSRSVKAQIFYQAQKVRSENWRDSQNKPKMELTIPIFRALIASDKDNIYYANHGQLGFALKDKNHPTLDDWKEAENELTKAIEIRGSWREKGWLFYEFNRAICRIKLDDNFSKGIKSNKDDYLIELIKKDSLIAGWIKLNKITF